MRQMHCCHLDMSELNDLAGGARLRRFCADAARMRRRDAATPFHLAHGEPARWLRLGIEAC
jgi:hypothetical protein